MVLLHAAAAHPRNKELQCDFVCQVETGERPSSWTIPSPPPLTTEDEGRERLGRTVELENAAETNGNLLVGDVGYSDSVVGCDVPLILMRAAAHGRYPSSIPTNMYRVLLFVRIPYFRYDLHTRCLTTRAAIVGFTFPSSAQPSHVGTTDMGTLRDHRKKIIPIRRETIASPPCRPHPHQRI